MTDKPLHALSLIEALQGIQNRQFTSEAYAEPLLARSASLDKEIQARTRLKPAEAIKAVRLSDRYRHSGGTPGPLQGPPIGIKDIYNEQDETVKFRLEMEAAFKKEWSISDERI